MESQAESVPLLHWLLHQQSKPHLVAHVQLPKSEAKFDNILGWCLGQNK